jgi:competence ComEA-like helix-hairpin-helix protein
MKEQGKLGTGRDFKKEGVQVMKARKVMYVLCFSMIAMFVVVSAGLASEEAVPAEAVEAAPAEAVEAAEMATQALDINSASADELSTLMDASMAAALVAYREANGPFTSTEDIKNVTGLDDAAFDAIKDQLTVTVAH